MKRYLYTTVTVLALASPLAAGTVYAHEHEASGTVSAVLHIEPNDEMTAGKPATFELEFHDTTGRFKLSDCGCSLQTKHDERVIATQSLHAVNDNTATGRLVFPETGEDEVAIIGSPKTTGAFDEVDLEFPVTVKPAANHDELYYAGGAAVAIVALFTASLVVFRKRVKR